MVEVKTSHSALLNEKAEVQQQLVRGNEDRLAAEQKLVAATIEATQKKEIADAKQYELVNKLIGYENVRLGPINELMKNNNNDGCQ